MLPDQAYHKTSVLVVGAGPAGLACAIALRRARPEIDLCVIDKARDAGHHNLSGALLEPQAIHRLLDLAKADWQETEEARALLARSVHRDDLVLLLGRRLALRVTPAITLARKVGLGIGALTHRGNYIVSIAKLTKFLAELAKKLGAEVLHGFAASDILLDQRSGLATRVKLVDQGLDKEGRPQPNYLAGELVEAKIVVLAEGCDGLVTERFIEAANLRRRTTQLYSVGVKELISVTPEQYAKLGDHRVVHTLGYPLWTPVLGPGMFGGGIIYPFGDNCIAVGAIVGADWKYCDFNPQDALTHVKNHAFVRPFLEGGKVVEAGAKMIPEGGFHAIPREPQTNTIGKGNVIIVGDSAGLVNMLKIEGLHNAIDSGIIAAGAIAAALEAPETAAATYTNLLDQSPVMREMRAARNFRQVIARCGNLVGIPLSTIAGLLPLPRAEPDYKAMTRRRYRYRGNREFDKATFAGVAHTEHREEQPAHLRIVDPAVCTARCESVLGMPCITFCPAGVYEKIQGFLAPANPSNCLHCKTCQRKCPFDNIRWTAPEGGGGPRYQTM